MPNFFIKPVQLRKLYFPYHSLDPLQAIDRIQEELTQNNNTIDDISIGVVILRKVWNKKKIVLKSSHSKMF